MADWGKPNAEADRELLRQWDVANRAKDNANETERVLRGKVQASFFPQPREGTNTHELPAGYKLTMLYGYDRKITQPAAWHPFPDRNPTTVEVANELQRCMRAHSNVAGFLADSIIKWTPTIHEPTYRDLPADIRTLVDQFITTKPKTPQVSIKEPRK